MNAATLPRRPDGRDRSLCIVVHDVAPQTWAACEWLLDQIAQLGPVPVTLLAVPRYHGDPRNAGFERWLQERAARGDEVALHGFSHRDEGRPDNPWDRLRRQVYTRGEGEFWGLDRAEATRRMTAGLHWLAELGLAPEGFVAPAWLLGPGAWDALKTQPFRYTCTLGAIHLLSPDGDSNGEPRGLRVPCQSQVYSTSTRWRQWLSVIWNGTLAWRQREHAIVRLELHPTDDVPAVARSWRGLAWRQAATRQVRTLAQVAQQLRT